MVLRFCVVLVALVALCPGLGNAAEIMTSREEGEEHCSIAEGQQYSGEGTCRANKILQSEPASLENSEQVIEEGNNGETKNEETQPTLVVVPVALQEGGDNEGKGNEPEPAIAAQSGGDGRAGEQRNEETQPTMMVVPVAITNGNAGETRNEGTQPNMIVVSQVQNSNVGETKNDETEPNMIVVSSVHNSNHGEEKNEESPPNMIVLSSFHKSEAGETGNEVSQPNMIVVSSVHNSNTGETGNGETQPAVQVDPSISDGSSRGRKIDTRKPKIVHEPDSSEDTSDEKNDVPTQAKLAFGRMRDDKENEIETLDKEEDKAEEEDDSMDVCHADENEIPDLLKDNHHIKKDLKCKMSNEYKIGVLKKRNSEAKGVINQKEVLRKQNLKREIDTKLAMDFIALLDKAMGYPYNQNPNLEVGRQYNPWRQYTMASMTPGPYQSYYS